MNTKIEDVMQKKVWSCRPIDMLSKAAGLMWDHDIGCLPVIDAENRPVAMITDRDICMSGYLSGRLLWKTEVEDAMSERVVTIRQDRHLEEAEALMRDNQLRRLAVVDGQGRLCGVISLSDLAQVSPKTAGLNGVLRTLSAISAPRTKRTQPHVKQSPAVEVN